MPKIHRQIKEELKLDAKMSDDDFLKAIRKTKSRVCKPCWEIKYCPYGLVVEQFPLLPPTLEMAKEHIAYAQKCLKTGHLGDGRPLDNENSKMLEEEIKKFAVDDFPEDIPEEVNEMEWYCIWAHLPRIFCV